MPLPPMPSIEHVGDLRSDRRSGSRAPEAAADASRRPALAGRLRRPRTCQLVSSRFAHDSSSTKVGSMPSSVGAGDQGLMRRSSFTDGHGFVDEHYRDAVADLVLTVQTRVIQKVVGFEVEQRALVLRTREDLEQAGIEGHGLCLAAQSGFKAMPTTRRRTSSTRHRAVLRGSGASRFRRNRGSVLDGRRLNHHGSPQSTVRPSR